MGVAIERFALALRPTSQMFHLNPSVKFGPVLPDGRQQRVLSSGPHWIASMAFQLTEVRELQEFRSYVTKMAGGAREIIIPVRDRRQAPWPTGYSYLSSLTPVSWSTTSQFDTSWGRRIIRINAYVVPGDPTVASAAEGTRTLDILTYAAGELYRGQMFSITDLTGRPRLYQIDGVPGRPVTVATGVTRRRIEIQPPLRKQIRDGQPLDFDNPCCTMTLDSPESGQMTYEGWYRANPAITLRESFG